jgi:hypothetical protein
MALDVKSAVAKAIEFSQQILEPQRTSTILVEEVESWVEDGRPVWLVTLSVERPLSPIGVALGRMRDYKTIKVDAETGDVISMKIRELANTQ